ncbi:MAG: HDIG domain-containing protein [Christensenellaceae bacterium]|nr:HDIG domain-containing protein [Christensenellaceae bacterium]
MKKSKERDEEKEILSLIKKKKHFESINKSVIVTCALALATAFIIGVATELFDFDIYNKETRVGFLDSVKDIFLTTTITTAVLISILLFMKSIRIDLCDRKVTLLLFLIVIIGYVVSLIFNSFLNLFIVPFALSGLLIAFLIDHRVGIMANFLLNIAFLLNVMLETQHNDITLSISIVITSMLACVIIIIASQRFATTRIRTIAISAFAGMVSFLVILSIATLTSKYNIENSIGYAFYSFLSIIISVALSMLVIPPLEYAFRVCTIFHISEITSLDAPLLKQLASDAPGTFSHSLMVGNLAELCAIAIGESGQLAKAAGYYHDIGKLQQPDYFIENQHGYNPHDNLVLEVSISIIRKHTESGYIILKDAKLPDIIANVAREHHGTTSLNYFLYQAKRLTEDNVDHQNFSYTSPKPSTKIAAIVMIVDTVEAAARAMFDTISTEKEYRNLINKLISEKAQSNQFSDCDITFKDLKLIEDTLVPHVTGLQHKRIKY